MPAESPTNRRGLVLALTTLGSFLTPFMSSSINIALPAIGREFGLNAKLLGWVATSFLLAAAVFLVPFGKLADLRGRRKIFGWGIGLYGLMSFLCAWAPSAGLLIAFRGGQGLAGAMIFSTAIALLTSVYPTGERGRVLGINTAAIYVGLSLGPFGGGILTQAFGWRSLFVVNGILAGLLLVLIAAVLRGEWAAERKEKFDGAGSVIFALCLLGLMYGLSRLPRLSGLAILVAGLAAGVGFVLWEGRAAFPVLNINLFRRNAVFAFSNLAALINYSATFAVTYFVSLYLQEVKGLSPREAGIILVVQPVIMAVFSPLTGRLSDKVEPRLLASTGMALSALGLFLFAFLGPGTTTAYVAAGLAFLGSGFALFSSPNVNAIMSSVDKGAYGVASATLATMRLTGQMLSMGLAILILSLTLGPARITPERIPDFLRALRFAFLLFAGLCALGVLASHARGRMARDREEG